MKRLGWLVVLLAAAGPGCLSLGLGLGDDPRKKAVEVAPPPPPAPSPVVVDDVNEKNMTEITRKLRAELEREEEERQPARPAESLKR